MKICLICVICVPLRKSNTEPIIRIYTESPTQAGADALAERILKEVKRLV